VLAVGVDWKAVVSAVTIPLKDGAKEPDPLRERDGDDLLPDGLWKTFFSFMGNPLNLWQQPSMRVRGGAKRNSTETKKKNKN
jgi:hypothetical protein